MDYIDHNFDWLEEKLAPLQGARPAFCSARVADYD
jgi:hypothetical protein